MSNVVALQPQRGLREYSGAQLTLIKRMVAADCNDQEFDLYMEVAKRVGLDPFRRQIYAVVYNKGDATKRKMSIIVAIDGLRAVANRNRDYRPDEEEAHFEIDPDRESSLNPLGLVKATVKVNKLGPDGRWYAVAGTAYWSEFAVIKEDGTEGFEWENTGEVYTDGPKKGKAKFRKKMKGDVVAVPDGKWASMPHVMLAKCAEAQALRKGWPEDLSGLYAPEEMERAMVDITPSAEIEQHETQLRLQRVGAADAIAMVWRGGEPIEAVPIGQFVDRCMAHLKELDSLTGLDWWENTNAVSLRTFWASHKADALAIKQASEARRVELAAE